MRYKNGYPQEEWLGILVSKSQLNRITNNQSSFEKVQFYEEAGKMNKLNVCYFSMGDISFHDGMVKAYEKKSDGWEQRFRLIPKVIHNRARFGAKRAMKLSRLIDQNIIIFNQRNLYGKLYLMKLLQERKDFRRYLPETHPCTLEAIQSCSGKFSSFFVKPNRGTLGSGIKKVNQLSEMLWEICYRKKRELVKETVHADQLPERIMGMVGSRQYHVQESIKLATYHGAPFDLRVSVQKAANGIWTVTGIVAKVAQFGHFLSNVAKGGTCYQLEEIFTQLPDLPLSAVRRNVEKVALSFVQHLEKKLPHLADVGFDFGIDLNGHPYYIEMNLRDQRYSFAKAKMENIWKKTYENPVSYANFLLRYGKEDTIAGET